MKLRVLLVDDHALILEGLCMMLALETDMEVVGKVTDACKVLEAVARTQPDVVCMDINIPNLNGIEATQQVLAAHPKLKVVGLSAHGSPAIIGLLFKAGATGYIIKSNASKDLPPAIRLVSQGLTYLSPALGPYDIAELEHYVSRTPSKA